MGIKEAFNKGLSLLGIGKKSEKEVFYNLTDRAFPPIFGTFGTSSPQWLQFRTTADYLTAWQKCPPLATILVRKAQADINGRVTFYKNGEDEPIKVGYNPTAKYLSRLFKRPNPLQTWRQFRAQQKIYQGLFGFCPVLMVKPAGFNAPLDTSAMWNLPPQFVQIKTTGKLIGQTDITGIIESIEFSYNNTTKPLPVRDVLLLTEQGISLNNDIIPDSKLRNLEYPISNIAAIYEAENVLVKNRGAVGILSNKSTDAGGTVPFTDIEKEELQRDFQRYGLTHAQWQVIITNANLEWQQMSMKVSDLMLPELSQENIKAVADEYGYPFELLGNAKGVTFSNKKEAKVMLYQDTIIPEALADFDHYNMYFQSDITGVEIYYDFDHVEALQTSEKDKAAALKSKADAVVIMYMNNIITLNKMREMMNQETVAGDDRYYSEIQKENADENTGQTVEITSQQQTQQRA